MKLNRHLLKCRAAHLAVFLFVLAPVTSGDEAHRSSAAKPEFAATAERVVVDFVVRDEKGNPLVGLAEGDIEVYEDGQRQSVESFQRVERSAGITAESSPKAIELESGTPSVQTQQSEDAASSTFVALVFDRLSPRTRTFAGREAAAWVETRSRLQWTGVFVTDQGLRVLQPFTRDMAEVRRAIDRFPSIAATPHHSREDRERLRNLRSLVYGGTPDAGVVGAEFAGALFPGMGPLPFGKAQAVGMEIAMLEAMLALDTEQQGRATVGGLLALVNALAPVPGRKAIVLFSEGLALPTAVEPMFLSLIAHANRANVSAYTVDTGGLRTISGNEEMRREMLEVRRTLDQSESGGTNLGVLMRSEEMLRLSPESGMGRLAAQTGGFLVRDTNELSPALGRIDEDLRGYYVLSYSPTNTNYDGRFRKISIKVRRRHGSLQARDGYFAVRSKLPTPLLAHEAPAIALSERGGATSALPIRISALDMPSADGGSRVPVVVEVDGRGLRADPDRGAGLYRLDFTVVVLVRVGVGRIVRKISQRYELNGPLGRLEDARKSSTLFFRQTELPPGSYTAEAAVWDAKAGAGGLARANLDVPVPAKDDIHLGSLVVIRQAEPVGKQDVPADHPLRFGEVLIYPHLGEPLPTGAGRQLAFLVTASASGPVEAELQLWRNGRARSRQPLVLPSPGADRIVRFVGSLPLDGLDPGGYELRLTATSGGVAHVRRAPIELTQ
jgi:VWFA-related protein